MKQRVLWSAVALVAGLAWPAAGVPAGRSTDPTLAAPAAKLVVWDWKSGDATAANYVAEGEGRLRQEAPRRHRRVRRPAVRPVLHLARRGHPVRQGPRRHAVQRRRADPRPRRRAPAAGPVRGRGQAAAGGLGRVHQGRQDLRRAGDPAGPPDLLQQGALQEGRARPGEPAQRPGTSSSATAPPSRRRPAPSASRWATRRASASSSSCRAWAPAS